jgi:DNA-binding PadR family transcriptional regulator
MKKLSVAKQVLNLLNTQGGRKPKQIIAETKASAGSVYNALNQLRSRKMVAKEEDGVYISQTQTSVGSPSTTKVTKRGRPTRVDMLNIQYVENLEKENKQLTEWTQIWKQRYEKLEQDYTQAKIMYLNSQAVVAYLEDKVAQLVRGN